MIDKEKLKKRFSDQAKMYDAFAQVQKEMAKQLLSKIEEGHSIHSILEVGCGTGYLTQLLIDLFPEADITGLDIAEGMINQARKRFTGNSRLKLVCADVEAFETDEHYDLIISNAAFQWLNHPGDTVNRLRSYLTLTGQLAFTTFGERTFHELYESHEQAVAELNICHNHIGIQFNNTYTWQAWCKEAGMEARLDEEELIEYFPSSRDFLHSVKKIGANSSRGNHGASPRLLRRLFQLYDKNYKSDKGIPATYEAIYAVCVPVKKVCILT